jgi:proteasome lid subunit RPN8/RPN11
MTIIIPADLLEQIHASLEKTYPEEGAGFLLGEDGAARRVVAIYPLANTREDAARHNRYLITPQDYLKGELAAETLHLEVIGVFHSHPDHPNQPSEYDREWAQPFFSYLITSVQAGKAVQSRSWRLSEDRARFFEEDIQGEK